MRICSFELDGQTRHGIVQGDDIFELDGSLYDAKPGKHVSTLGEVRLRPPVIPSKLVCVGRNYAAHARERGVELPKEPLLFMKPPSALIGTGDSIELMPEMGRVEHEAELAIVIGRQGRFIPKSDVRHYVLGYTCANDVSDRDYQKADVQFTRAKGFDTFCPLGPWIETDLDPSNVSIRCTLNGDLRQDGMTSDMIFDPITLVAHISRIMTLVPGDVILTGSPAGVSPIKPGDTVEIEIEGIGRIANPVVMVDPATPPI